MFTTAGYVIHDFFLQLYVFVVDILFVPELQLDRNLGVDMREEKRGGGIGGQRKSEV